MPSLLGTVTTLLPLANVAFSALCGKQPSVTVKNGTLMGLHVDTYNQDLYLGIPYAQPPVGDLRLQNPQSLNSTFTTKQVTKYADSCVGYGNSPAWPFTLGEDCLTLNVIKPLGVPDNTKIPVGVFLHGGGWVMDYSANGVYNLSFIVQESVRMGKPIVAVSLDYRLSAWGFLASQDVLDAGVANLGLKDQRLALQWINENIASFGGDPDQVTIFGESAGGGNVWYMAAAYGGRDDGLFRALISESGAEGSHPSNLTNPTKQYNNITQTVGCGSAADKLDCLRKVDFDTLNRAINATSASASFYPIVDGDFLPDHTSSLLAEGKFIRVPMIAGTNADEGTLFTGGGINTDEQIRASIKYGQGLDDNATTILMSLYPNVDSLGLPAQYHTEPDAPHGKQYKRAIALSTDQGFLAERRLHTDAWSNYSVPVYSYLFDSPLSDNNPAFGTPHFTEIGYVFYNTLSLGYAAGSSPLADASQPVLDLAKLMSHMWVAFIHDLDPNNHDIPNVEQWPLYNSTGGYGQNFYFHPSGSGAKPDTDRLAGTTFINSVAWSQYGR